MFNDYLELLQCLNASKVKYLIIGGYAVIQYTEPRYTKDMDIWVEASMVNAKRLLKALNNFGAPTDNLSLEELAKPGLVFVFGVPPLRVDILNKASGSTFATAWKTREVFRLGDLPVKFVSKKTLIKLKKSAGRPQDIADLIKLQRS